MELACWCSFPAVLTRCNNEENCTGYLMVRAKPSNLWFHAFFHTGYTVCTEGPRLKHNSYCSMVDNQPHCLDTHDHRSSAWKVLGWMHRKKSLRWVCTLPSAMTLADTTGNWAITVSTPRSPVAVNYRAWVSSVLNAASFETNIVSVWTWTTTPGAI